MTLAAELARLEASGLIRLARATPGVEYAFQHALVQDAAYASLLRQDRRRLHRLAAAVLERSYPDRPKELAPILAHHYHEASEAPRALHYYRLAAQQAAGGYALQEAIGHLNRVVEIASSLGEPTTEPLRERGCIRELIGDLDAARADLEAAVDSAREHGDRLQECEALLDLGLLWSARDYARSGEYLDRALALAREAGDAPTLARTLNRVANWRVNADEPQEALPLHAEALAAFEQLNERRGEAETLDVLGMCHFLAGDPDASERVYQRAIPLLRELDDRFRLVSSLVTHSFRAGGYFVDAAGPPSASFAEVEPELEEALSIATAAGLRSSESYCRLVLGMHLVSAGKYERADQVLQLSLDIATQLNHRQWTIGALCGQAIFFLDLLLAPRAVPILERSVMLSRDAGSVYWLRVCSAALAEALTECGQVEEAEEVLKGSGYAFGPPPWSLAQRMLWHSRARVSLARGQAVEALQIMDELRKKGPLGPRLIRSRASALIALRRFDEAQAVLDEVLELARRQGSSPLRWRLLAQSAEVKKALGNHVQAAEVLVAARAIVDELASTISNTELREAFRAAAWAQVAA